MFGNIWWHSFVRGSGPPASGCHFRLLRFIPDVLHVGMLPKWSDDLLDMSSDTCALLNLATCHKRTSQQTYGLEVTLHWNAHNTLPVFSSFIERQEQWHSWSRQEQWQLVKALRYKPEGRRFDSRWCHWNFLLTKFFRPHCGPGVDSASNRNEYQVYFLEVKAAGV